MCAKIEVVLCVNDVLMTIATVVKSINRTVNQIEKHIFNSAETTDTLKQYMNFEIKFIRSHLPTPPYHVEFLRSSNIDKKYFNDLLLEAHYAMGFYYNSIDDILKVTEPFTSTTNSLFEEIQFNLKNGIICQYRNILEVYSYEWPSINQIKRIQFYSGKYQNAPSLVHNARSIVIARLLREWMERLHSVIINLESKFT